jgi:hypothetical protein
LFYWSGAHKVSNSKARFTDLRVCLAIAKVTATFSIVFQNEANLTLPYLEKYFLLHMTDRGKEPEGGDNDEVSYSQP